MRSFAIFLSLSFITVSLFAQEKITFLAEDNLEVTADLYEIDESFPFVLLFHQSGSSRGEFLETAARITRFGYNCLAVDLRFGEEENFIRNETAIRSVERNYPNNMLDCRKDIRAAIKYASERSGKNMVLLGSSFSASLCLVLGKESPEVDAVIAFSPGEFFQSDLDIKEELENYPKPVFAAGMKREKTYLEEMFMFVPDDKKTIFVPETEEGQYGAKALWKSNSSSFEYWLGLLVFFKSILPAQ
ncbi:MAG: dienelactone hydrolase family protein [Bacteroidales bacterium]|nr:MAG: dienelactone hydrolase family protein [Bacteroidales bacterium]